MSEIDLTKLTPEQREERLRNGKVVRAVPMREFLREQRALRSNILRGSSRLIPQNPALRKVVSAKPVRRPSAK